MHSDDCNFFDPHQPFFDDKNFAINSSATIWQSSLPFRNSISQVLKTKRFAKRLNKVSWTVLKHIQTSAQRNENIFLNFEEKISKFLSRKVCYCLSVVNTLILSWNRTKFLKSRWRWPPITKTLETNQLVIITHRMSMHQLRMRWVVWKFFWKKNQTKWKWVFEKKRSFPK